MSVESEIESGQRFGFGENWARFLEDLNEDRIIAAEDSLKEYFAVENLNNIRFLDIGSGSGLFSLAAKRLGADVYSFDFDTESVACTTELRRRYFPEDASWEVRQGSVLDTEFIGQLGKFDIVYSWGVLHHTGEMWRAFENAISRVDPESGRLFIAIYNDQGWKSHVWWLIKAIYNRLPGFLKGLFMNLIYGITNIMVIVKYTIKLKPMDAIRPLMRKDKRRGMSKKHDRVDWIGGFPYEFAGHDELVAYFEARGFTLFKSTTATSLGCHELVFNKV